MLNATVYPVEGGFGYSVEGDGVNIVQEFNPFWDGWITMTQEEAQYFAQCIVDGVEPTLYMPEPPAPPA